MVTLPMTSTICAALKKIPTDMVLRGPSALAELLVLLTQTDK